MQAAASGYLFEKELHNLTKLFMKAFFSLPEKAQYANLLNNQAA